MFSLVMSLHSRDLPINIITDIMHCRSTYSAWFGRTSTCYLNEINPSSHL